MINEGNLRFALTCRHVKWDKVDKEHHWKGKFDESNFPPYNGETEGMPDPMELEPNHANGMPDTAAPTSTGTENESTEAHGNGGSSTATVFPAHIVAPDGTILADLVS